MRRMLPALLLLAACGTMELSSDRADLNTAGVAELDATAGSESLRNFWLDVEPGEPVDGMLPLPASFGPFVAGSGFELTLPSPVEVRGTLVAERVSPWFFAPLPGTSEPMDATIVLHGRERGGSYFASVVEGAFDLNVLPDIYDMSILPDHDRMPSGLETLFATEDTTVHFDLGQGVPIWGRVLRSSGGPLADAEVLAETTTGEVTTSTRTDLDGWYELRVTPGHWRIITTGTLAGRLPTLTSEPTEVDKEGARVDLEYFDGGAADLLVQVISDASREPLANVPITLESTSLIGFSSTAVFKNTLRTDQRGFLETTVPAGLYEITIAPQPNVTYADEHYGSLRSSSVLLTNTEDLDVIALPAVNAIALDIKDQDGTPVPNVTVRCEETWGSGRTTLATSNDLGQVGLDIANVPGSCLITPPSGIGLAATLVEVDEHGLPSEIHLGTGVLVEGRIQLDPKSGGGPLPLAVVRLRDVDGVIWAYTLTDLEGYYTFRVDFTKRAYEAEDD